MYNDDNQSYNMKRKKDYKYLRPVTRWSRLESEGIICLSATVTVDESHNMNADSPASEPYLEGNDPIVF